MSFNNLLIEGNNWWIIDSLVCKGKRKTQNRVQQKHKKTHTLQLMAPPMPF